MLSLNVKCPKVGTLCNLQGKIYVICLKRDIPEIPQGIDYESHLDSLKSHQRGTPAIDSYFLSNVKVSLYIICNHQPYLGKDLRYLPQKEYSCNELKGLRSVPTYPCPYFAQAQLGIHSCLT